MTSIKVNLKNRSYNILVGRHILENAGKEIRALNIGDNAYIITNALIKNKYGSILKKSLKQAGIGVKFSLIPDTEKSKSINTASKILTDIASFSKNKKVFIIALGGGVVGDLSGFTASIYKRGTPYVHIGTTLLAQVDSSIGGKTGVDLPQGKNLIGTFYQPKMVISDVNLLKTLDKRQLSSGLAEVIKYGIIKDKKLFEYLESNIEKILKRDLITFEFIVRRASSIKADIVERDELEKKGLRTILNFGHTLGHAIEAAGKYAYYNHGESVSIGMLIASDISAMMRLSNKTITKRIENLLKRTKLPTAIGKIISLNKIIKAHYQDKKFSGKENRFVLLKDIGKVKVVKNIPQDVIKKAILNRK